MLKSVTPGKSSDRWIRHWGQAVTTSSTPSRLYLVDPPRLQPAGEADVVPAYSAPGAAAPVRLRQPLVVVHRGKQPLRRNHRVRRHVAVEVARVLDRSLFIRMLQLSPEPVAVVQVEVMQDVELVLVFHKRGRAARAGGDDGLHAQRPHGIEVLLEHRLRQVESSDAVQRGPAANLRHPGVLDAEVVQRIADGNGDVRQPVVRETAGEIGDVTVLRLHDEWLRWHDGSAIGRDVPQRLAVARRRHRVAHPLESFGDADAHGTGGDTAVAGRAIDDLVGVTVRPVQIDRPERAQLGRANHLADAAFHAFLGAHRPSPAW